LTVRGVTDDGFVVYTDQAQSLYAVVTTGGNPVTIRNAVANAVQIDHTTVFFWAAVAGSNVGSLSAWTSAGSAHVLGTACPIGPTFVAANAQGTSVLFFDSADPSATGGTLYGASSDGTGRNSLVGSPVALSDPACAPRLVFGASYAFAAYCASDVADGGVDGGAGLDGAVQDGSGDDSGTIGDLDGATATLESRATVAAFSPGTWAQQVIATSAGSQFSVDPTGQSVLVASAGSGLTVHTPGGAPSEIDTLGTSGLFRPDGAILYVTANGSLRVAPVADGGGLGASAILATDGTVASLAAISPDGQWALGSAPAAPTVSGALDLILVSATQPGPVDSLSPAAGLFGDPFTADSSHAMFVADFQPDETATLYTAQTDGGSAVSVASGVWSTASTSGGKVIFNDNLSFGLADIQSFDTSSPSPHALLVRQANQSFFLTPSRAQIVYSCDNVPVSLQGVWILSAP
jgi:hypothetical protein